MGWFSQEPAQEKIDLYTNLLDEKQERLAELNGVETGSAALEREELEEKIQEIKINVEQAKEDLKQDKGFSLNNFND